MIPASSGLSGSHPESTIVSLVMKDGKNAAEQVASRNHYL
jgi:hypothetical protein